MRLGAIANAKKRRACTCLVEQIQNAWSQVGIGTVVKRQRDDAFLRLGRRQPRDIGAKPSASRKHASGGNNSMVSCQRRQHQTHERGDRTAVASATPWRAALATNSGTAASPWLGPQSIDWPSASFEPSSSRRADLSILPRNVRGMESTNTTLRGTLWSASRPRHHAAISRYSGRIEGHAITARTISSLPSGDETSHDDHFCHSLEHRQNGLDFTRVNFPPTYVDDTIHAAQEREFSASPSTDVVSLESSQTQAPISVGQICVANRR